MKFRFTKKKEGELVKPSTASVPAVVFLFLLLLMASTVMRETTLNVEQAEAVGRTAYLKRSQDVAFVYVSEADEVVSSRYNRNGYTLLFNDAYATGGMIEPFVAAERRGGAQQGYKKIVFRVKADATLDKRAEQDVVRRIEEAIRVDSARASKR